MNKTGLAFVGVISALMLQAKKEELCNQIEPQRPLRVATVIIATPVVDNSLPSGVIRLRRQNAIHQDLTPQETALQVLMNSSVRTQADSDR